MSKDLKQENREEFLRQSQVRGWVAPDLEYVVDASFANTIDACIEVVKNKKKLTTATSHKWKRERDLAHNAVVDDIIKDLKALK